MATASHNGTSCLADDTNTTKNTRFRRIQVFQDQKIRQLELENFRVQQCLSTLLRNEDEWNLCVFLYIWPCTGQKIL